MPLERRFKIFLVYVSICPAIAASQERAVTSFSDLQLSATRVLLLQLSRPTGTPGALSCSPLPTDPQLLKKLEYNSEEEEITFPGLSNGLKSLPTGLLRFAYCISAPPPPQDTQAFRLWLHRFDQKTFDSKMRFISPNTSLDSGFPESLINMGKYRPHSKTNIQADSSQ